MAKAKTSGKSITLTGTSSTKAMEPVIVEQTYSATPVQVWQAITSADQMRQWYFESIELFHRFDILHLQLEFYMWLLR